MSVRQVFVDYYMEKAIGDTRSCGNAEAERHKARQRRFARGFVGDLLKRRPDMCGHEARTAVDLYRLVDDNVGDPADWDYIGTVIDLLDWMRHRG